VIEWIRLAVRGLRAPPPPKPGPIELPRTIWMLWLQGWDEAPELMAACARTWRRCNPGWELRLLAASDLPALIGDDPGMRAVADRSLPPESFSNVVRMALLLRYGGVWADATTYCLRPLDDWLPALMRSGFFAFTNVDPDRMIASWFLAAEPQGRLLQIWQEYLVAYWRGRRRSHRFFWFHGALFGWAYRLNREFRAIWKATPTLSSAGPSQVNNRLGRPLPDSEWEALERSDVPLLKLRYRRTDPPAGPQSAYRRLVDRAFGEDERAPQSA
jgi:hypothetical protein